ncbi:MAG TPA: SRPBCC domain-containing protein [Streptosporangiaceae bacterium]
MATVPGDPTATVTLPTGEEILITRGVRRSPPPGLSGVDHARLVRRWWGGDRGEVTSVEIDLRAGGRWRYVMVTADGSEAAFHGEYREIVPGERIVCTEVFEGRPRAQALTTVRFADSGERTTVTIRVRYGSQQDRDAHGVYMRDGLQEAMALLEQAAVSLLTGASGRAGEHPVQPAQPGARR